VVESLGAERVIFLPDEFLGRWVASQTGIDIVLWKGHCVVHERFTPEEIRRFRAAYAGIEVLAHPECPPEVLAEADYVGSTSGMIRHVSEAGPARVLMITECSMADNVAVANPGVEMVRPCNICPYMNTITLPKILRSLQTMTHEVTVDLEVAGRARRAVERMLEVGRGRGG
jgi:quinolinate synthase